jgi:hypothetical protein
MTLEEWKEQQNAQREYEETRTADRIFARIFILSMLIGFIIMLFAMSSCSTKKFAVVGPMVNDTLQMESDTRTEDTEVFNLQQAEWLGIRTCQDNGYDNVSFIPGSEWRCLKYSRYGDCRMWRVRLTATCVESKVLAKE